ncbi:head-tail joining protein [Bartonella heixiaziensis]|uniref:head-tail joining protein n=1 Tax=Bartonella heixiaziensis TaxID=1461000 RepID=UPI0039088BDB
MRWHGLLNQMVKDVRNTFGQPIIYTRKDNQQSFRITAIYTIKHSESDAGGRIPTTIARKELDLCINDIGGLPPKPEDSVIVMAPENTEDASQEHFVITDVQDSESGMYKLILREIKQ